VTARTVLQKSKRGRILSFIREKGQTSRGEIALEFSMDKKVVSVIVDDLLSERILAVSGFRDSGSDPVRGRRRELLAINGAHSACIGIDLGATHVTGVLSDLAGTVLDRAYFEVRPGLSVDLILDQMKTISARLLSREGETGGVRAVGVCVPGFVHPVRGVSLVAENIPGWRDVRVREIFQAEIGRPVALEDSSRAFATAERWLGKCRGLRDFIALDLGYGIGMGMYTGGALHTGSAWKSGEIGHTIVDPEGMPCTCGNRGCLETIASGRAIARQAADGIRAGRSPLLHELTHGNPESVTAQDVALASGMKDPFSTRLLQAAGNAVGLALANAVNLLNPSVVVLGGGLVAAGPTLTDALASSLARCTMPGIREDMRLELSELGDDGSARGMALIAAEGVFEGMSNG
jgi:predicted NBD/HSP70 family sugar kinase